MEILKPAAKSEKVTPDILTEMFLNYQGMKLLIKGVVSQFVKNVHLWE
jgi:hypothetical protein